MGELFTLGILCQTDSVDRLPRSSNTHPINMWYIFFFLRITGCRRLLYLRKHHILLKSMFYMSHLWGSPRWTQHCLWTKISALMQWRIDQIHFKKCVSINGFFHHSVKGVTNFRATRLPCCERRRPQSTGAQISISFFWDAAFDPATTLRHNIISSKSRKISRIKLEVARR